MTTELIHSAHTVGETNLHMQFTPAYRRDIFRDSLVRELTIAYLVERAQQLKIFVSAIDCGTDHIHLFIENWKNYSIAGLACELKKYSSRKMQQGHKALFERKIWGGRFWSGGYFHRTVGVVTKETVKKYVKESQKKHWEQRPRGTQATLLSYG
ncbi:MAG TPA: IS200/IS605 family transposase [Candidatus Hodarchaeales archaeon]|nr:IS200/IS605 family transposase [Candidatus Hodarchaeales archaeon]